MCRLLPLSLAAPPPHERGRHISAAGLCRLQASALFPVLFTGAAFFLLQQPLIQPLIETPAAKTPCFSGGIQPPYAACAAT